MIAINEWALMALVLNVPFGSYLLLRWWLFKRARYAQPTNSSASVKYKCARWPVSYRVVRLPKTQSSPVSGAGSPDAGTGDETG